MSKDDLVTSSVRLEELQEGSRAAPKESELCLTLGEAFLRINRVDEAAASYQRAIELDPRSDLRALYWEWLGLVREMEGRLEEALEAYFQWLDAEPVSMSPLDRVGTLLVVLNRWTDLRLLRPQYIRRSEIAPSSKVRESLALYTFVIEQLGEHSADKTKESTMLALEADPDSPSLRFLLGLLTYQEGSLELSRGEFERVLELDSDGLWQEQRFALDWNGTKAKIMVAKLARMQGDLDTALTLMENTENLDRSDSEGLSEVAELMLENGRYDELISLLSDLPPGPSRIDRLRAEGLLSKGLWSSACSVYSTEAALLRDPSAYEQVFEKGEIPFRTRLEDLWSQALAGRDVERDLKALRPKVPQSSEVGPARNEESLMAVLSLWQRAKNRTLSPANLLRELEQLCSNFPDTREVWELAEQLFSQEKMFGAQQLSALLKSKLVHGSRSGPNGIYRTRDISEEVEVFVTFPADGSVHTLRLEAELGRGVKDQLFGWGCDQLLPSLDLAKGVLENLDSSYLSKSFRVMSTLVSTPQKELEKDAHLDSDLGNVAFALLVALLSTVRKLPARRLLVLGRLGLRGSIDGIPNLEDGLMAMHQFEIEWDHLIVAQPGGFRLLRCPSWLWYEQPFTVVCCAQDLLAWNGDYNLETLPA